MVWQGDKPRKSAFWLDILYNRWYFDNVISNIWCKNSPLLYLSFNVIWYYFIRTHFFTHVVVIQSLSCYPPAWVTLWTAALQTLLSSTISPEFALIHLLWSWWCYLTHLSICLPFLISPSIFPSISSSFQWTSSFLSGSQIMWELQL